MKCCLCGLHIPEDVVFDASESGDTRRGLFHCPHCDASHLRELIDHKPDGTPVFQFRLWGHPATTRRRFKGSGAPPKNSATTAV